MAISFPQPRHMPCSICGAAVERSRESEHVCDNDRRIDYEMFHLRDGIETFAAELAAYLETPRGRFERWYAARDRGDQSSRP